MTILVHPITQTYKAWQRGTPMPAWVRRITRRDGGELFHIRQSGDQLVNPGEYLVQDIDGVTVFYTEEEFRKTFAMASQEGKAQ